MPYSKELLISTSVGKATSAGLETHRFVEHPVLLTLKELATSLALSPSPRPHSLPFFPRPKHHHRVTHPLAIAQWDTHATGQQRPQSRASHIRRDKAASGLNLAGVKRTKPMQEPMGLTSVFGHQGLGFQGWHLARPLDVLMRSREASDGDQAMLDLAGWATGHRGQLPCGTKTFTGGDKREMLSGHTCGYSCPFPLQCDLGQTPSQGTSKCSSQGSRVP